MYKRQVYLTYGAKTYELPFSITLNDFIADKYPGTEKSYKSFESKVTVNKEDGSTMDYRIYMNHVLDHRGYRFFQSGFDPDEGGTILSVNHDFWGTWVTYIGYFLLYFGLMAILFDKNTRFGALERTLNKIKKKKANMTMLALLLVSVSGFAQQAPEATAHMHKETSVKQLDSVIKANAVSKEHAAKFARLVIQDLSLIHI